MGVRDPSLDAPFRYRGAQLAPGPLEIQKLEKDEPRNGYRMTSDLLIGDNHHADMTRPARERSQPSGINHRGGEVEGRPVQFQKDYY